MKISSLAVDAFSNMINLGMGARDYKLSQFDFFFFFNNLTILKVILNLKYLKILEYVNSIKRLLTKKKKKREKDKLKDSWLI